MSKPIMVAFIWTVSFAGRFNAPQFGTSRCRQGAVHPALRGGGSRRSNPVNLALDRHTAIKGEMTLRTVRHGRTCCGHPRDHRDCYGRRRLPPARGTSPWATNEGFKPRCVKLTTRHPSNSGWWDAAASTTPSSRAARRRGDPVSPKQWIAASASPPRNDHVVILPFIQSSYFGLANLVTGRRRSHSPWREPASPRRDEGQRGRQERDEERDVSARLGRLSEKALRACPNGGRAEAISLVRNLYRFVTNRHPRTCSGGPSKTGSPQRVRR
jgi:hypothetical protein